MSIDRSIEAAEIAVCLGCSARMVRIRGTKEHWPYTEIRGNGGLRKEYIVSQLPADVQQAVAKHEAAEAKKNLPALRAETLPAPVQPLEQLKGWQRDVLIARTVVLRHLAKIDELSFTGLDGVYFTGVTGVTKTHGSGQWVFQKGHEYLFEFDAAAVDLAGPVYVNNEIYTGQHTIYKERTPVQVGFMDGFPFSVDAGAKTERVEFNPNLHITYRRSDTTIYQDEDRWKIASLRTPSGGPTSVLEIRLPAPEISGYERILPSFAEVTIWVENEPGGYGRGQAYLSKRFINLTASSG